MRHRPAAARMPLRMILLALALALAFVATGCQVTLSAGIDMGGDGSGTVHAGIGFDDEALAEVGDLGAVLRADDLRAAGWEVVGPAEEDDGLTWVRASRHFDDPEEAAVVAAQLSGPGGPFLDFRVTHERSLLRTRTSFSGVVDLSAGLVGLSDADLQAALGDFDLGLDLEALRARFGDGLADRVRVQVSAGLPGKVEADGATLDGGRAEWAPAAGERVELSAVGDLRRLAPLLWGGLTLVVAAAGLAVVVLRARVRKRRRQARR